MNADEDGYLKVVAWSEEDGCYLGTCPGLFHGGVHGDDEVAVYRALREAVAEHIRLYKEDGRPLPARTNRTYSGKISLRLPEEVHQRVALRALQAGQSINEFVVRALSRA